MGGPAFPISDVRVGLRSWLKWGAFGALCGIKINVVGEIYIGEIIAALMFFPLMHARSLRASDLWLLFAGLAFSLVQLLSDIYNATPLESAAKGTVAPLLFCATILSFVAFFERDLRRIYPVLAGVALIVLLQVVISPNEYQEYKPWKFGYGQIVLTALTLWISAQGIRSFGLVLVLVLGFAAVSILNDARSLAGLPLLGLWAYALFRRERSFTRDWLSQGMAPLKLLVVAVPLAALLSMVVGSALTSDWVQGTLEPAAAMKYRQQAGSDVGLLLAGRSEWLVSIRAFLDSPLLGHGSWAVDKQGYLGDYAALRLKYGMADEFRVERSDLIPAHSYLLGAMVWAGVAGGAFWLLLSYRVISRYVIAARYLPVYFHVGIVSFIWDLLFSPFGAQSRWATALFVAALLAASRPQGPRKESVANPTKWSP